jgi:hypothetical protein
VLSFSKGIDGPTGRRRSARRQICVLGSAVTLHGSKSVLVEDICPDGAKLVGRSLPAAGEEMLLRTNELAILARVAWAKDDERGIVFEEQGALNAGDCLAMQLRKGEFVRPYARGE